MRKRSRNFRGFLKRLASITVTLGLVVWSVPALAYRPFDGTDAAVAKKGEVEVELQPAGGLRDQGGTSLIAPSWVINYGLTEDWEAVFEGLGQTPLSPSGPTSLTAAGAFLKHVIVPGSLQDKAGASIATEFGILLPDSTGNSGVGVSFAGIVSQRWDWGTIHLNAETALTRDHRGDLFLGAIIEGPSTWNLRPVAEIFYENVFGNEQTFSGLVGLIYRVSDDLSLDVAVRHALTGGHPVNEIRAGLTFGFPRSFFEGQATQRRRSTLPR
jgi:hypothetical protein